ncbi:hypothetical protein CPB84DRAFT_1768873 [Gymnopilus junonius]|uniref:PIN domain-like protein n=1 Tax=Gymnopilus junonius TaxID=109634 RepID=A0A9P5NX29_GYMJU|nr:hypothetical protein CPB84DRAFT_1768873 [Gymnopilus junonius]
MRDKEGRVLVNAHVLGFLRRISKLLFYGIKPVFVFDGGAPALKRNTLNDRRKKKSGAATSHSKLAEKLLAAQLRREALNHADPKSKGKNRETRSNVLDENTVYLEDVDGSAPKTPAKRIPPTPSSSSQKKNKFRDQDPYSLPEVNLEETISKATRSAAPDPRLATEDELQAFIEQMRPEDFNINSPAFRELPTEVQYEIIGDLRLKSRQTSYARLHKMLTSSKTPLDFSKQQIENLRQRNALTQQLLITTDTIGSAHIAIPVRIASERNKEYILMKNEGEFGGWILGIKDTGTREKPIVIDHEDVPTKEEDSDADMEEVEVPMSAIPDSHLREYRREMALDGISKRNTTKGLRPLITRPIHRKTKTKPATLFDFEDDATELTQPARPNDSEDDDDLLAYAIQQSLDQSRATEVQPSPSARQKETPSKKRDVSSDDDFYVDFTTPNRLDTALSIANAGASRINSTPSKANNVSSLFRMPSSSSKIVTVPQVTSDTDESMEEVVPPVILGTERSESNESQKDFDDVDKPSAVGISDPLHPPTFNTEPSPASEIVEQHLPSIGVLETVSSFTLSGNLLQPVEDVDLHAQVSSESDEDMDEVPIEVTAVNHFMVSAAIEANPREQSVPPTLSAQTPDFDLDELHQLTPPEPQKSSSPFETDDQIRGPLFVPSRTPSPTHELESRPSSPVEPEDWDPAHEIDVHAEEGEFARFMSQVKGKDVDDVRREIDEEIEILNQQRKIALRDSEDITQQMVTQIMTMLRLFGIPYITAPMEAEAQCAELVSLGLVDGVITDDSDVFLFGAQRVYKNMFNQSKTVECFLLSDLSRELGLDRDTLIQLAYLLGSDYTEGLPGVGPVVAMELLKEFPGHNGLHKFKDWWIKVQSGKDRPEDNESKFRKQFKKKFKKLYLPSDWPNSVVRDAYYHPTVDSSEEPFKWGIPDLDGLRAFFQQELSWKQSKVDELLLPIIQRMNKRNQAAALNRQGNLNEFLDISAGNGTYAPRQRQAYQSKRLQQVISDFRKRQRSYSLTPPSRATSRLINDEGSDNDSSSSDMGEQPLAKKQKRRTTTSGSKENPSKGKEKAKAPKTRRGGKAVSRGRGRSRGGGGAQKSGEAVSENDDDAFVPLDASDFVIEREVNLRPRIHKKAPQKDPSPVVIENNDEPIRSPPE